jgi:hypothetical protein
MAMRRNWEAMITMMPVTIKVITRRVSSKVRYPIRGCGRPPEMAKLEAMKT